MLSTEPSPALRANSLKSGSISRKLDEDVLSTDFSTTTDLYGVVGNINKIRIIRLVQSTLRAHQRCPDPGNPSRDRFDSVRHCYPGRYEANVLSGVTRETQ
jgi:hypothetical protein